MAIVGIPTAMNLWFFLFLLLPGTEILSGKSLGMLGAYVTFSWIFFNPCMSCMVLICSDVTAHGHRLLSGNLVQKQAGGDTEATGNGFSAFHLLLFPQCPVVHWWLWKTATSHLFYTSRDWFFPLGRSPALSWGGWTTQCDFEPQWLEGINEVPKLNRTFNPDSH